MKNCCSFICSCSQYAPTSVCVEVKVACSNVARKYIYYPVSELMSQVSGTFTLIAILIALPLPYFRQGTKTNHIHILES